MKSFLIAGAGKFGKHLAKKFTDLGNDVLVIDKNEEIIESLNVFVTDSYIGDCTNEEVLRSIGVDNFDACFVAIDSDFQSSLEVTSLLKELGAKWVVSCAKTDRQESLLKKVGADDVIFGERVVAEKTAIRYNAKNVFDLIQLNDEYSIYEIALPSGWAGQSIEQLHVRKKFKVNIIAVKENEELNPMPGPDYVFKTEDHIVVIGKSHDVEKLTHKA